MTIEQMDAAFKQHIDEEYLKFERIAPEDRGTERPDLHGLNVLDMKVPGSAYIVSCATHDEIFLSVDPAELAKVVTEEEVIELLRCGVRFDSEMSTLCLFV